MPNYQGISSYKQVNKRKSEGKTSKFFGVNWHKHKRKWRAEMRQGEKKVHIGFFESEIAAAWAYKRTAEKYYGKPVREKDILA